VLLDDDAAVVGDVPGAGGQERGPVAQRDQRMGDPARSAAKLENPGAGSDRVVHDGGFAHRGYPRVELGGTAVWGDHPGAAPVRR
jgi:hypothetical protein